MPKFSTINKLAIILIAVFAMPLAVSASTQTGDSDIIVKIDPTNPAPLMDTKISIEAYSFNLDSSEISWTTNGVVKQKEIGLKQFAFKTGRAGERINVLVRVTTNNGDYFEKTVSINPASVDIIWQSNNYVPGFYRGKSLASQGGTVRIYAVPTFTLDDGRSVDSKKLTYKWSRDFDPIPLASGYGKNYLDVVLPSGLAGVKISVSVVGVDSDLSSSKTIQIKPSAPKIILYEERPLSGTGYDDGINDDLSMSGNEITLRAEPYFFPTTNPLTDVIYSWTMNKELFTLDGPQNRATLRKGKTKSATTNVAAHARSSKNGSINASASVSITQTGESYNF